MRCSPTRSTQCEPSSPESVAGFESAVLAETTARVGQPLRGGRHVGYRTHTPPWSRSGDDLYLLYTGGTTGMPKGVMWRQDDLFSILNNTSFIRHPVEEGLEGIRRNFDTVGSGSVGLPACPLMHGTGALTALSVLNEGGSVVTLESRSLDAIELLDVITAEKVQRLAIVGDAFSKPMVTALEAHPGSVGHLESVDRRLLGNHVESGRQGGTASPPPQHASR